MIIYGLLLVILTILDMISSVLGVLIPDFPVSVQSMLDSLATMISGGLSFISYFTFWEVVVALLSLIIAYHTFRISKDALMKVFGHFFGD